MSTITIKISKELKTAFKMMALRKNKTMTELILENIKKTIKKNKNDVCNN